MTTVVNVQEAKTRLSELLHRVESGEEVVIARSGREVARLEPISPRVRDFSTPLLPDLGAIDVSVLFDTDDEELGAWERSATDDPLTDEPERPTLRQTDAQS